MAGRPCAAADRRAESSTATFEVRVALESDGPERPRERNGEDPRARAMSFGPLIESCTEAVKLVPGLAACEVLETAPDRSWQLIRHVIDYSWYCAETDYEFRATYEYPAQISIERISGDLERAQGSWNFQSDGDYTVAHYAVELAPGFWVPHWLVRVALRRDLPKMLRALRARAEVVPPQESR